MGWRGRHRAWHGGRVQARAGVHAEGLGLDPGASYHC